MAIAELGAAQPGQLLLPGVAPVLARSTTLAIAHDYLTQRGGAERVVLAMARAFPGSPIHTSLYHAAETYPEFADLPILSTSIDRYNSLRQHHRLALPLLARTFSQMAVAADIVVCSSSGWAHGVRTEGRKIVYCHNPARWLYQADGYEAGRRGAARAGMKVMHRRLLRWDQRAAHSADRYLVNSRIVRDRVWEAYGIDAEVLPAPHTLDASGEQNEVPGLEPGYVLCVSRLMSYKNVDVVIEAMRGLPHQRLVVVGGGPEEQTLRDAAPGNVRFLSSVDDAQLRWLYANSCGLVSASYEDFGLTPLEGASFGKPAALLRWGGFLDTLDEGTTGVFFDDPTPVAVGEALQTLVGEEWDADDIRRHAARFSEERFVQRLHEVVVEESSAADGVAVAFVPPTESPVRELELPTFVPASHSVRGVAPIATAMRGLSTKAVIAITDAGAIALAMLVAFVIWGYVRVPDPHGYEDTHLDTAIVALPVWLCALAHAGLYRARLVSSHMEELRRILRGSATAVFGVAAVGSLARLPYARLWLAFSLVLGVVFVGAERIVVRAFFRRNRKRGRFLRPVVIVGANAEAAGMGSMLEADTSLGYMVTGYVSDDAPLGEHVTKSGVVLGRLDQTLSLLRRVGAGGVVIATTAVDHDTTNRLTRQLTEAGVHVELSSSLRDVAARRLVVRPVGRVPLVYVEPTHRGGWRAMAKRAFDVTVACGGLVVMAPILALAAIAIKIDSRGPVFFRQRRLGRHGMTFGLLKLRTMVPDAEARLADLMAHHPSHSPLFKMAKDPRVTRVGRFLRRTSLDEVPQLWNVLLGEMSIVGPRPALSSEMSSWTAELHGRLRVRPGITGMWQVNGRSDSSFEDYERLDLYYVDNWTLWSDVAIVARTVPAVLRTRGAY